MSSHTDFDNLPDFSWFHRPENFIDMSHNTPNLDCAITFQINDLVGRISEIRGQPLILDFGHTKTGSRVNPGWDLEIWTGVDGERIEVYSIGTVPFWYLCEELQYEVVWNGTVKRITFPRSLQID